jgi:phosphopantetheinyl transferase
MRPMVREAILLVNSRRLRDTEAVDQVAVSEDFIQSERHFRPLRRRQFLAGRSLLRAQLQQATGVPREAWRIAADGQGRPQAFVPGGPPGPDVSLSHSGELVAAALAMRGRIGVDVEMARAGRAAEALARAVLSTSEQAVVEVSGERAFLRFWTLREAIGKAGVALGDGPVSVTLGGEHWILAHRAVDAGSLAVAWRIDEGALNGAVRHLAHALDEVVQS